MAFVAITRLRFWMILGLFAAHWGDGLDVQCAEARAELQVPLHVIEGPLMQGPLRGLGTTWASLLFGFSETSFMARIDPSFLAKQF